MNAIRAAAPAQASVPILRPTPSSDATLKGRLKAWALDRIDFIFRILRNLWPIPVIGKFALVTRFDDVEEVMSLSQVFVNPYNQKLDVIMDGHPFFLGMTDSEEYTRDTTNMRMVVRRTDIESTLIPATLAAARSIVAGSGGQIEIVDLVRTVTFDVLCDYFGTPGPADADLRVWATRLFEFQFADQANDPALRAEVDVYAPALRKHIDSLLAARKSAPPKDDVLGRCLELQRLGLPGMDDATIRTNLVGFIVGGLPQPPMVAPQAMEQLLRRPDALAQSQQAANQDDDRKLAAIVFEALRFDPLAPALLRTAAEDYKIAAGSFRARTVRKGTTVAAAIRSAMHDGRRVPRPEIFDPTRRPYQYMHFGYGLHTCFGLHINLAVLPLMLKPVLQRRGLKRAPGPDGHLSKKGIFADRLLLNFDQ
jgi:cytochrome P450